MHPDAILTGLRHELERLDKNAPDHKERKAQLAAEIEHAEGLERPAVNPDQPTAVADPDVGYLAGLKQELSEAPKERHRDIKAEIARVEKAIKAPEPEPPVAADEPAEPEEPGEPAVEAESVTSPGNAGDGDGSAEAVDAAADAEPGAPVEDDLEAKSRRDLNEIAAGHGIESPEQIPDKDKLVQAIREKRAAPTDG